MKSCRGRRWSAWVFGSMVRPAFFDNLVHKCSSVKRWCGGRGKNNIDFQDMTLTFPSGCHSDEWSKISLVPNDNQLFHAVQYIHNFVTLY